MFEEFEKIPPSLNIRDLLPSLLLDSICGVSIVASTVRSNLLLEVYYFGIFENNPVVSSRSISLISSTAAFILFSQSENKWLESLYFLDLLIYSINCLKSIWLLSFTDEKKLKNKYKHFKCCKVFSCIISSSIFLELCVSEVVKTI